MTKQLELKKQKKQATKKAEPATLVLVFKSLSYTLCAPSISVSVNTSMVFLSSPNRLGELTKSRNLQFSSSFVYYAYVLIIFGCFFIILNIIRLRKIQGTRCISLQVILCNFQKVISCDMTKMHCSTYKGTFSLQVGLVRRDLVHSIEHQKLSQKQCSIFPK